MDWNLLCKLLLSLSGINYYGVFILEGVLDSNLEVVFLADYFETLLFFINYNLPTLFFSLLLPLLKYEFCISFKQELLNFLLFSLPF